MSRKHSGQGGAEITLPITPMLDMSFQLLFFFMATFNPTEVEGAQALSVAKEAVKNEKPAETQPAVKPAKDPKNVDLKQGHKPPTEPLELDVDLKLLIKKAEQGGDPITLSEGPNQILQVKEICTVKKEGNKEKKEFNKTLRDQLAATLEKRKKDAENTARRKVEEKEKANEKLSYDDALKAEMAKLKVRIQTQNDTPWGDVFDAMNLCTEVGFPGVALSPPVDWQPKVEPK